MHIEAISRKLAASGISHIVVSSNVHETTSDLLPGDYVLLSDGGCPEIVKVNRKTITCRFDWSHYGMGVRIINVDKSKFTGRPISRNGKLIGTVKF